MISQNILKEKKKDQSSPFITDCLREYVQTKESF